MRRSVWVCSLAALLSACGGGDDAPPQGSSSGSAAPTTNANQDPPVERPGSLPAAATLTGGALFQGVKLPLFGANVVADASTPLVQDRPGLLRLYVTLPRLDGGVPLRARLQYLAADGREASLEGRATVRENSSDRVEGSTLDLALPAEFFHAQQRYRLELWHEDRLIGSYPSEAGEHAALPSTPRRAPVHVVVVPVEYQPDGASEPTLPDLSAAQLELMRSELYALYPASEVTLTVRPESLSWREELGAGGRNWERLLNAVLQLRDQDDVRGDVYYYGMFTPPSSLGDYCSEGCVLGLSELSRNVADEDARGSIGLGYTGQMTAGTFVHELGHAHGRYHAPCGGAGGPDRRYPHRDGATGSFGWDVRSGAILPATYKDFMGYCDPVWTSEYTWRALFDRITGIAGAVQPLASVAPQRFHVLRVGANGHAEVIGQRTLRRGLRGKLTRTVDIDGQRVQIAQGELDHLDGELWYVPVRFSGHTLRAAGLDAPLLLP